MKITWLGHACFKVESDGYTVVLDPYKSGSVEGLRNLDEAANEVFCSHGHGDHNAKEEISVIEGGKSPFTVTLVDSFHDEEGGVKRGPNTITVLNDGKTSFCHLGDLGHLLSEEQVKAIGKVDVLAIPVGGFFTIDAATARRVVDQLSPELVIPMHYRGEGFGYGVLGTVEQFTEKMDKVTCLDSSCYDSDEKLTGCLVLKAAQL